MPSPLRALPRCCRESGRTAARMLSSPRLSRLGTPAARCSPEADPGRKTGGGARAPGLRLFEIGPRGGSAVGRAPPDRLAHSSRWLNLRKEDRDSGNHEKDCSDECDDGPGSPNALYRAEL